MEYMNTMEKEYKFEYKKNRIRKVKGSLLKLENDFKKFKIQK